MGDDSAEEIGDERSQFGARVLDRPAPFDRQAPAERERSSGRTRETAAAGARRRYRHAGTRLAFARLRTSIREAAVSEWERGTAFLFVPVCLSVGALVYFYISWEPSFAPLVSGAAALSAAYFLARSKFVLRIMLLAALLVVGGVLAAKFETWRASTKMLGADITTRIVGRVVTIEHQASGRVRLTIDIVSTSRPHLRYAPERIRASARKIPDDMRPGTGVKGVVRMFPPSGPLRPSSYDFSFKSYFDGLGASGFFLTNPENVSLIVPATLYERAAAGVARLREALADHVRAAVPGPNGEIGAALVAGVQSGIPNKINEALRITGVAHVLSISGLHMALVAGIVLVFVRLGFALFPGFSSRHPTKKYAAAVALAAIAFYLLISGAGVATERSFIMLAVMLTAVLFDRAGISMRNFAIAALAVVLIAPHEIVGPSFQMSFAATAALISGYAAWGEWRQRGPRRAPPREGSYLRRGGNAAARHVVGLAATSLIAGTATALFAAWHFQRVSPLGLVANLSTMPIVSVVVMPFMVLGLVLMPFGLDGPAFAIMGKGIGLFTEISVALSKHSPFDAIGILPGSAMIFLTVALVILTMTTTRLRVVALPFLAVGIALIVRRPAPDLFISEDARLVALRLSDGGLAINRKRPNAFTMEDWSRAMMATEIVKPGPTAASAMPTIAPEVPFACTKTLCIAWNAKGVVIAHAATEESAREACAVASLIVIDDATAKDPCAASGPAVITKRDLARYGAAAVTFEETATGFLPIVEYSIEKSYRPWHAERIYSRAARGLPPYQRKHRDEKGSHKKPRHRKTQSHENGQPRAASAQ
ncbi:MAG: ComEC family competence protein [Hyphomicrobiales bacterium]|nr:ComEC family competence protein [Hyphomicrobiales bacterium]